MKKQFILLGALGIAGLASTVFAFELISPGRKWFQGIGGGPDDLPVLFSVNSGGESSVSGAEGNSVTAVRSALQAWNAEIPGLVTTGTTSSNAVGNDGQNVVSFEDPAKIVRNAIAVTLVGFYDSGQTETVNGIQFGRYVDTDISFSKRLEFTTITDDNCSGEYDIQAVATHEGGHALGLAHSAVGSALMAPSVAACTFKRITQDDANGIHTIYDPGFGGGNGCQPSETRLASLTCSTPSRGRNCLVIDVGVVNDCDEGVSGADVTVQLTGDTGDVLTGTASTNGSGTVSFGLRCRDAASTSYTAEVISITSGLPWDANDPSGASTTTSCSF